MRSAVGGADGSRTHDLSIANAALSQLSYGPGKDAEVYPRRFRLATIMRSVSANAVRAVIPALAATACCRRSSPASTMP